MAEGSLLDNLVLALRRLPGVGPKSAQRMAFYLLQRDRPGAASLAEALRAALEGVGQCQQCRDLTESACCRICADARRDPSVLCVVEHPADVIALEQATAYRGRYFVLHGNLSPLDGVGPEALGLDELEARLRDGGLSEVILATSSTVEGEATAHFIAEQATVHGIPVTGLAQGVPMGGELEYIDSGTLARAFSARRRL